MGGEGRGRERRDGRSFPAHPMAFCKEIVFFLMSDGFASSAGQGLPRCCLPEQNVSAFQDAKVWKPKSNPKLCDAMAVDHFETQI